MTHVDLFSGIGGFALAAHANGIRTVQFCEIDSRCRDFLRQTWPGVAIHDNIRTFHYGVADAKRNERRQYTSEQSRRCKNEGLDSRYVENGIHAERAPFLLTAGVPCQPASRAGKQRGEADDRWLWPEAIRVLRETSPAWCLLKILLASETWSSTEFLLTWKLKATKSKCLVFQLAPSMPRTGANATGLSESAWPTPMSRDVKGQMFEKGGTTRMDYVPNVLKATWSTPNASDGSGGGKHPDKRVGHPQQIADQASGNASSGCLAQTEKFVVRLMTLSAWLMGYTGAYLALWETASCRKSRRES